MDKIANNYNYFHSLRRQILIDCQIKIRYYWLKMKKRKELMLEQERREEEHRQIRIYARSIVDDILMKAYTVIEKEAKRQASLKLNRLRKR